MTSEDAMDPITHPSEHFAAPSPDRRPAAPIFALHDFWRLLSQ